MQNDPGGRNTWQCTKKCSHAIERKATCTVCMSRKDDSSISTQPRKDKVMYNIPSLSTIYTATSTLQSPSETYPYHQGYYSTHSPSASTPHPHLTSSLPLRWASKGRTRLLPSRRLVHTRVVTSSRWPRLYGDCCRGLYGGVRRLCVDFLWVKW